MSEHSDEPPERPASARQRDPGDVLQAPGGAAASRGGGPGGAGADSGLLRLGPPPLQEARLQELQQHLPAVGHAAPLQHPVR